MIESRWFWVILGFILFWWLCQSKQKEAFTGYGYFQSYPEELGDTLTNPWEWYWYQQRKTQGVRVGGPNYHCPGCFPRLVSRKFECWN